MDGKAGAGSSTLIDRLAGLDLRIASASFSSGVRESIERVLSTRVNFGEAGIDSWLLVLAAGQTTFVVPPAFR